MGVIKLKPEFYYNFLLVNFLFFDNIPFSNIRFYCQGHEMENIDILCNPSL